jgi:hypothetical protein
MGILLCVVLKDNHKAIVFDICSLPSHPPNVQKTIENTIVVSGRDQIRNEIHKGFELFLYILGLKIHECFY